VNRIPARIRVVRLLVDEGDAVRAGDTLAVRDREELAAEFRAQLAQAERASAQSSEVIEGPRAGEIQMARADLASAEAELRGSPSCGPRSWPWPGSPWRSSRSRA
jgi:multidrug efflux pump subunit AcrA (membrane-fusion protein)